MRPTDKKDAATLLDRMDALLAAPRDDPKALISALRGITMASGSVGGCAEDAVFRDAIYAVVDVCTAYVQDCITGRDDSPYPLVVRQYITDVGDLALKRLP